MVFVRLLFACFQGLKGISEAPAEDDSFSPWKQADKSRTKTTYHWAVAAKVGRYISYDHTFILTGPEKIAVFFAFFVTPLCVYRIYGVGEKENTLHYINFQKSHKIKLSGFPWFKSDPKQVFHGLKVARNPLIRFPIV